MRVSKILSLRCKTFFVDLYSYFILFRKTQYVARQFTKNRLGSIFSMRTGIMDVSVTVDYQSDSSIWPVEWMFAQ